MEDRAMLNVNAVWQDCLNCAGFAMIVMAALVCVVCGLTALIAACGCRILPEREVEEGLPFEAALETTFLPPRC
jgi:hypothetical protein